MTDRAALGYCGIDAVKWGCVERRDRLDAFLAAVEALDLPLLAIADARTAVPAKGRRADFALPEIGAPALDAILAVVPWQNPGRPARPRAGSTRTPAAILSWTRCWPRRASMSEGKAAGDLLLDIGGTKILSGLVDRSGRIVVRRQNPTRPDFLLPDVIDACRDLIVLGGRAGRRINGIGAKGAVNPGGGRLVESLYLGHGEIPMGIAWLGFPVRVENDVHAATVREMIFGIGRSTGDFLFFNAGTGMAIGVVVGDRLYRGASNTAGENGHATIDRSGSWPCRCGMSGCVETMIVRARKGRALSPLSGEDSLMAGPTRRPTPT